MINIMFMQEIDPRIWDWCGKVAAIISAVLELSSIQS